jgi:hypothetical protein
VDPLPADTDPERQRPDFAWARSAASKSRAWAIAIAPNPACRSTIRADAPGGGSAPPVPEQDAGRRHRFPFGAQRAYSITPIHVDLTRFQALEQVASWVGGLAQSLPKSRSARMTARIRLQPEAIGMGMTSHACADRLIERLRGNGISDERVLNAIRAGAAPPVHR